MEITHELIDQSIRTLDLNNNSVQLSFQPATLVNAVRHALKFYGPVRVFLLSVTASPLFSTTWGAALKALVLALDAVAAAVPPVTAEAVAGDLDPNSADPSFKAGKDL